MKFTMLNVSNGHNLANIQILQRSKPLAATALGSNVPTFKGLGPDVTKPFFLRKKKTETLVSHKSMTTRWIFMFDTGNES